MTTLKDVWRATFVRRWHKSPDFYDTGDMQHGHAGRMAVMALWLWPRDLTLSAACTLHDMGEGGSGPGDVCGLAKSRSDALADAAADMEAAQLAAMGFTQYAPNDRVHFLDRLDAYWWAMHHKPWLSVTKEWRVARAEVQALAQHVGVEVVL